MPSNKNTYHLKPRTKRIIYILGNKTNLLIHELSLGQGKEGQHLSLLALKLLIKKGIVGKIQYNNDKSSKYYLTDTGLIEFKKIAKIVDEYKRW